MKKIATFSLDLDLVLKLQEWDTWQYKNMSDMANALLNIGYRVIVMHKQNKEEGEQHEPHHNTTEQVVKREGTATTSQEQHTATNH